MLDAPFRELCRPLRHRRLAVHRLLARSPAIAALVHPVPLLTASVLVSALVQRARSHHAVLPAALSSAALASRLSSSSLSLHTTLLESASADSVLFLPVQRRLFFRVVFLLHPSVALVLRATRHAVQREHGRNGTARHEELNADPETVRKACMKRSWDW